MERMAPELPKCYKKQVLLDKRYIPYLQEYWH